MVSQYNENKRLFLNGVEKLHVMRQSIAEKWELVRRYDLEGKQIVFWAANAMMERFLQGVDLPECVRVVDSNPAKAGYFSDFPVMMPEVAENFIRESGAIFIFTKLHAQAILDGLHNQYNKTYSPEDIHIVDYDQTNV